LSLNPKTINFDDYTILFYIPRVIAKPGIPLTTSQEYAFLIGQAVKMKTPMVNLLITENDRGGDGDKENDEDDEDDDEAGKLKKKKVRICVSVSSSSSLTRCCIQGKESCHHLSCKCQKERKYPSYPRRMDVHQSRGFMLRHLLFRQSRYW
jgi:hypothetical protein